MSVIAIKVDGTDITDDVMITDATFTSLVSGSLGQAMFRVKDSAQTYAFNTGDSLTLDVDGVRVWGGYVMSAKKIYALPAMDSSHPGQVARLWRVIGTDYNALFQRRIVFKASDPTGKLDFEYSINTYDDTIIDDIFDNYLTISGDGLTRTGVTRIAKAVLDIPGHTPKGLVASAGFTWKQMMDSVARATGGVYYISPDKVLTYVDAETTTSPYTLTDVPYVPAIDNSDDFSDDFNRTVGPGTGTLGGPWVWSNDDSAAVSAAADNVYVDGSTIVLPTHPTGFPGVQNYSSWRWGDAPPSGTVQFDFWVSPFSEQSNWSPVIGVVIDRDHPVWGYVYANNNLGEWWIGPDPWGGQPNVVDVLWYPDEDAWYTFEMVYDVDRNVELRVWKVGDPRPSTPNTAGRMTLYDVPQNDGVPWLDFYYASAGLTKVDNFNITSVIPDTPEPSSLVGYQKFTIMNDGVHLVNDFLFWSAGGGSPNYVYSREQDAASIATHGRWQQGLVSSGIYRQTSADIVANSYVYGTPQSHRGGKDNALVFSCRVFQPLFKAGDIVDIECHVFGFNATLPLRSMTTTFASPTDPIFDLVLTHDIDEPLGLYDQIKAATPSGGVKIKCPPGWTRSSSGACIPPPPISDGGCDGCDLTIIDDDLNRTVVDGWGGNWVQTIPGFPASDPTQFSVDGSMGTIVGRYVTGPPYPNDPWVYWGANLSIDLDSELLIKFRVNNSAAQIDFSFYLYSTVVNQWSSVEIFKSSGDLHTFPLHVTGGTDSSNGETVFTAGTWESQWLWCRMRATAFRTEAKFWLDGDPEPSTWLYDARPFPLTPPTAFIIGVANQISAVADYSVDVDSVLLVSDRCAAVQFDNFQRTVGTGWGIATPGGQAWLTDIDGVSDPTSLLSAYSVSVGVGQFDPESTPSDDGLIYVTPPAVSAVDVVVRFSVEDTTTVSAFQQEPQWYFAYLDGSNIIDNQFGVDTFFDDLGSLAVAAHGTDHGGDVNDVSMGDTTDWGTTWNLHFRVTGGRVEASLWRDGTTEPAEFMVQGGSESYTFPNTPNVFYSFIPNVGQSVRVYSIDFGYADRPCYIDCGGAGFDTFERTVSGGWGNATAGPTWTTPIGADGELEVLDGYGLLGNGNLEYNEQDIVTGLDSAADFSVIVKAFMNASDVAFTFASLSFGWLQYAASADDAAIYLNDGLGNYYSTVVGNIIGSPFSVFKAERASGVARLKVWDPVDPEPDWMLTGAVGTGGYSTEGIINHSQPDEQGGADVLVFSIEYPCADVLATAGTSSTGKVCETIGHSPTSVFYQTSKAFFSGTLEVYINGVTQTGVTTNGGADGVFMLSGSLALTDVLYVCYYANGSVVP